MGATAADAAVGVHPAWLAVVGVCGVALGTLVSWVLRDTGEDLPDRYCDQCGRLAR